MARVKGGKTSLRRRRNILAQTKGYRFGRSTNKRQAREAIVHAGKYAFAHRRDKKNDFRRLWNVRLNAALRENGTTYSRFIGAFKKNGIILNRKVLAGIAADHPETWKRIIARVS